MITVRCSDRVLVCDGRAYPCAVGRGGATLDKHEGDGATPLGIWPLRHVFYRPDRLPVPPRTQGVAVCPLAEDDLWCDDPAHPDYNQRVKAPHSASCERMWREDGLYDVVGVLGYNDRPVIPHRGSAIFLHVARPEYAPTRGCIALALPDLLDVLARCGATTRLTIV